jgi:uncharacterized protein YqgC (DUF456 family)
MLCYRFTFIICVLPVVPGAALILCSAMLFELIMKRYERAFKYTVIRNDQN